MGSWETTDRHNPIVTHRPVGLVGLGACNLFAKPVGSSEILYGESAAYVSIHKHIYVYYIYTYIHNICNIMNIAFQFLDDSGI